MANVHIIFTIGATTAEKLEGTSRAVHDDSLPIGGDTMPLLEQQFP